MKRINNVISIGVALVYCAVLSRPSHAGGIQLYEISTPDVALASAGYAARAQDASTLFKSPAGMSLLPGSQLQASAELLYGDSNFSADSSTGPLLGSDNGGNSVGAIPEGSIFFTQQLNDRLSVGFGMFSYFGLAQQFNNDWVGRYYVQKDALLTMSLMPAVSLKVNDWLSIGAGLNATYGYLSGDVAVRTGGTGDGQMSIEDSTWGFGGNAGILIEPQKGTRFGVTYLSPVKLDFKDSPNFSNLGPLGGLPIFASSSQLNVGMTVPQSVMLGGYHELNPKWALMADLGWQNWGQFGKVEVGVDSANPTSLTKNMHYQDTWHGAIGAQYRLNETWTFSTGFAYDSSAVSDADRTLALPMGEAYRIGLGAAWQMSKAVSLGVAYEFMWAGDMSVVQDSTYRGRVSGSFDDTSFHFLSVGLNWKI
jgi:long-chain fatty acid transport protein